MPWRLGWLLLVLMIGLGCDRASRPVFVDLDRIPAPEWAIAPPVLPRAVQTPDLPAQEGVLSALQGADLNLGDAKERMERARQIIVQNREAAQRSLAAALYRAYSVEAEAARRDRQNRLRDETEALWNEADAAISKKHLEHASKRFPLAVRIAFLVGFPFSDLGERGRPEQAWRARRYDQAIKHWQELLSLDDAFHREAERLMREVEERLAREGVEIQIEFTRRLNEFADRARQEAAEAVSGHDADIGQTIAQRPDITISPTPEASVTLPAVEGSEPPRPSVRSSEPDWRRHLESELNIWLAQNGYHRVPRGAGSIDLTEEFADWLKTRRVGR